MSLLPHFLAKYGKDITLQTRVERIINGQPQEVFATFGVTPIRAILKTVRGVSVFDDTNTEQVATHEVRIAYQAGVTSEMWILYKAKRIKILTVENCCEDDTVLILMCTERGDNSKVVNDA